MDEEDVRSRSPEEIQRWVITVLVSVLSAGVIGFVNFVFITGRYTEKFSSMEGRMSSAETNIQKMNTEGTYASKSQIRLDESTIARNTDRLTTLEAMVSKLPVMESQLNRIDSDLKEAHNQKHTP